jgi:hypothetical protein
MNKIKFYLKQFYRLTLSLKKQEEVVWTALKKLHADAEWKSGTYEKEKTIQTVLEISNEQGAIFHYMIFDYSFHCRVKILEDYPIELTTDLFILAAHFNNLLINGVVIVNVDRNYVEYHDKKDLLVPLLFNSELYAQMSRHYNISKDIYSAYQRLIIEQEAPAIIIADLIKSYKEKNSETK